MKAQNFPLSFHLSSARSVNASQDTNTHPGRPSNTRRRRKKRRRRHFQLHSSGLLEAFLREQLYTLSWVKTLVESNSAHCCQSSESPPSLRVRVPAWLRYLSDRCNRKWSRFLRQPSTDVLFFVSSSFSELLIVTIFYIHCLISSPHHMWLLHNSHSNLLNLNLIRRKTTYPHIKYR